MIVVSDTSPIHYLVLTGTVDILAALFTEIVIPPAVFGELQHPRTPGAVRNWASNPPDWLIVPSPESVDSLENLGRGEAEAISLAAETRATLLLTDDRRARHEAETRGLAVVGTVGVLAAAAKRQIIGSPDDIAKLRQTNFHIADRILDRLLADDAANRTASG